MGFSFQGHQTLVPHWGGAGVIAPVAAFSADVLSGDTPLTVTFTDESTNTPTSWDWDFGDGTAHSTDQNPTHIYNIPGTFTVTLIATNAAGSDTETKAGYITVNVVVLLSDLFTTQRAAGAVNGTAAEPGPGTRAVVDSGSKITISAGGELLCSGGLAVPVFGDPHLIYAPSPALARAAGVALSYELELNNAVASNGGYFGLSSQPSASAIIGSHANLALRLAGGNTIYLYDGTNTQVLGLYAVDTVYTLAFVLRGTGVFYLIKGGAFGTNWSLLYVINAGTASPLYPSFFNANFDFEADNVNVYNLTTTEWGTDNGAATQVTASPGANATITANQDFLAEFTWTPGAGETLLLNFRYADDNNRWYIECVQAAGTIKLYKVEAGVSAELDAGKTQTWSAGTPYRIVLRVKHGEIKSFVNNVAKHSYTGASHVFITGSNVIKTSLAGANLIAWPYYLNLLTGAEQTIFNIDRGYATRAAAALAIDTYDGSDECTHPDVYDAGSGNTWNGYRYWMVMTPLPGGLANYENPSIMVSDDGNTWSVPAGGTNPIDASPGGGFYNSDPDLLMVSNTLYCYYREANGSTADRIKLRTSTDGINWTAEQDLFNTAANACASPSVIAYSGQYVMFSVNATRELERRTASDPAGPWSDPATVTLPGAGAATLWHINVTVDGSRLFMVWNNDSRDFYISYSDDAGLTWATSANRVIAAGGATWDAYLYRASIIRKTNGFDMWYGAYSSDATPVWKIGRTSLWGVV